MGTGTSSGKSQTGRGGRMMGRGISGKNGAPSVKPKTANQMYSEKEKTYSVDYMPYSQGYISKTDAGQLYKASKNGDLNVKKELISELYDGTKSGLRLAASRYSQNPQYYDSVYRLTHAILNKDWLTAQKFVDEIQDKNIKLSTKKSPWYKYKNIAT